MAIPDSDDQEFHILLPTGGSAYKSAFFIDKQAGVAPLPGYVEKVFNQKGQQGPVGPAGPQGLPGPGAYYKKVSVSGHAEVIGARPGPMHELHGNDPTDMVIDTGVLNVSFTNVEVSAGGPSPVSASQNVNAEAGPDGYKNKAVWTTVSDSQNNEEDSWDYSFDIWAVFVPVDLP